MTARKQEKVPLTEQEKRIIKEYKAKLKSGEIPKKVQRVDMTPESFSWQEVETISLAVFTGKSLPELHATIDKLVEKYGPDVHLAESSSVRGGGWSMRTDTTLEGYAHTDFKVMQYKPAFTHEQYIALRNQRFADFEKKYAEQAKVAAAKNTDRMTHAIKKLRASQGLK